MDRRVAAERSSRKGAAAQHRLLESERERSCAVAASETALFPVGRSNGSPEDPSSTNRSRMATVKVTTA